MGSDRAHRHLGVDDHISIHAPRMGSDGGGKHHRSWTNISIHAPRMGSDCAISPLICPSRRFQSTLPGWGATVRLRGDVRRVQDFNPRSPDGERPWVPLMRLLSFLISIHAPRMGSDGAARSVGSRLSGISIHAPRMGSDDVLAQADPAIDPISIHAPRMGSDPDTTTPAAVHDTISIHAPRMGSD